MGSSVLLVLLIAALCAAAYGALRLRSAIRSLCQLIFHTDSLKEGLALREKEVEETPKSLGGFGELALSNIQKDFPEFHWPEWQQRCERTLKEYYRSLEAGSLTGFADCSSELKEQVRRDLEERNLQGLKERFDSLRIHGSRLYSYRREPGLCCIRMQSAVEYLHTRNQTPVLQGKKEQHRMALELWYVQDADKAGLHNAVRLSCPNCGAPISNLGSKRCDYCGTAVEPVNIRVWSIHRIENAD